MGSPLPMFEPKLLASYSAGRIVTGLNVGYLFRQKQSVEDAAGNVVYEQTMALTWNAGIGVDVFSFYKPQGLRIALEWNGMAGINFESLTETPMELLLGAKYRSPKGLIFSLGAGPGSSSGATPPVCFTASRACGAGWARRPKVRRSPSRP